MLRPYGQRPIAAHMAHHICSDAIMLASMSLGIKPHLYSIKQYKPMEVSFGLRSPRWYGYNDPWMFSKPWDLEDSWTWGGFNRRSKRMSKFEKKRAQQLTGPSEETRKRLRARRNRRKRSN